MLATVRIFESGNSQAVRLPKAFRLQATEAWIRRHPVTGALVLQPKPTPDERRQFLDALRALPPSDEFIPARDDAHRGDPFE